MNRRFALNGGSAVFGMLFLLAALIGVGNQSALAQRPEIPTLSLTGTNSGWNTTYYPDGRIWTPQRQTIASDRSILVPVFIKNCWRSTVNFEAFPIYSMKFKVQFDSTALEFVGVEKNGPLRGPDNTPIGCLAERFEFSVDVDRDTTYQSVIDAPIQNRLRGKRVMITGISSFPLPQTGDINSPCDQRPFVELVYLRFNVVADPVRNPVSARTPLIVTNDTLFYNDFQVGFERAFPDDPQPATFTGLGGVDNYFLDANQIVQIRDPLRPSKQGMLWVEVTDLIPQLSFTNVADPRFRLVDSVNGSNGTDWFIVDPITIDVGTSFDDNVNGIGTRDIDVINSVIGSRATDITVQSDSKWLKFKSFLKGGQGEINPFPQPVREGTIPMLDKGILGTTLGITPNGDPTVGMRDLNFRVICDPNELEGEEEIAGTYEGYITFKSKSLAFQPVRVKVTFIYFRNPFEPNVFDEQGNWEQANDGRPGTGILLEVRNSSTPALRTYMVFGVGHRATDMVDTLFGETVYENPLQGFGARWYPRNADGSDIYINGLGDLWAATPTRVKSASRDIRDIYAEETILYWCKFDAGGELNYPVVISWDTDDFSPGSELFMRDIVDGNRFNINMRDATSIGGTRYSYTITDADIEGFVIEYTLPKVAYFPVINKGWNLLSMPVNPARKNYEDVFNLGLNVPIRFTQNSYQDDPVVDVGVGYFVKYSDEVDTRIAGARVNRIDEQMHPVRLYDGWNTIGSLSDPITTEEVSLVPYGSGAFPEIEGDIFGYVTDRGYQAVTEIRPGLGYWIKITGQAYLQMVSSGSVKAGVNFSAVRESMQAHATAVSIADAASKGTELYIAERGDVDAMNVFELPPLPPNGLFDARFSNHAYVEDAANPMIRLQGVTYPVTLTVNDPARNYTVVNPITGEVLGNIVAGRNNVITIADQNAKSIRLMGDDADLGMLSVNVTPNPVSSNGVVNVTVPEAGNVTVELFNLVGERIATLLNDVKSAGVYGVDVNAAQFPAGRYIVKVSNGGSVVTSTMTIVR